MTYEEIRRRYRKAIKLLQWVGLLTETEAISAIIAYKQGSKWACEAVDHFGGTKALVTAAWRARVTYRRLVQAGS